MLGKTYDAQVCSIARALELVGERWSFLIVRDAVFAGVTRFNDFQHNLGIATNILKARLDGFVEAGLMERRAPGGQSGQRVRPHRQRTRPRPGVDRAHRVGRQVGGPGRPSDPLPACRL